METAAARRMSEGAEAVLPQLTKIVKRDGRVADFDASKITAALLKAGEATGEFGAEAARQLTMRVLALYQSVGGHEPSTVEGF